MKKLTIIPLALMLCSAAYGQGELAFANGSASTIKVNGAAATKAGQPTLEIALFYQADPGGAAPAPITSSGAVGNWTQLATVINLGSPAPPGIFNGGNVVLPGITGGANAWIEVISWNNSFTTLAAALANASSGTELFGTSPVFAIATIDPTISPKPTDNLLSGNPAFTGANLTILPSPEPTTIALGGIGAAALLLFRRRK